MKLLTLLAALTCSLWGQQSIPVTQGKGCTDLPRTNDDQFYTPCHPKPAPKPAQKKVRMDYECTGKCLAIMSNPPLDVPAIQETQTWCTVTGVSSLKDCPAKFAQEATIWTCADKRNYQLQTSEDGQKHNCHRLP